MFGEAGEGFIDKEGTSDGAVEGFALSVFMNGAAEGDIDNEGTSEVVPDGLTLILGMSGGIKVFFGFFGFFGFSVLFLVPSIVLQKGKMTRWAW